MAKRYARLNWQNTPSVATPINATNLNKMDKGIDDIDTALNNLENSIVGQIVNDPTKINNAAVNYSLANQISELNKNLGAPVELTLSNCAAWGGENTVQKISKRVFVTFGVQITATLPQTSLLIASLPAAYCPRGEFVYFLARAETSGKTINCFIDKSNRGIYLAGLATNDEYICASLSFEANE